MHARIATFEGRPEHIEKVRQYAKERFLPQSREFQGYAGQIHLGDPDSGRGISVMLFENEEALQAGDRRLDAMSPPDDLEGTKRVSVEHYEVALHEFEGEPAAARLSRLEGNAEPDEFVRYATENIQPRARNLEGWKGLFVLLGRQTGKHVIITVWESTDALRASEEQANQLRQESVDSFGGKIAGVERYEVLGIEVPVRAGTR
jgi:heme-degrading monooxygenase HmoA